MTIHAAGRLEGGLTFGYKKFINDIEGLQVMAETAPPAAAATAEDRLASFIARRTAAGGAPPPD